jgi:subtilisin family serine protease
MRKILFLFVVSLVAVPAGTPALQNDSGAQRVIVMLRADVALDGYAGAFVADARTRQPIAAYHARDVVGAIMSLERSHGFKATAFFSRAIRGFAATLTAAQRDRLARDPLVATIEPDIPMSLPPITTQAQVVDWGISKIGADISSARSGDGTGVVTGVNVYVIDTGVDPTHPDINLVNHVSFTGAPNADCNGHGTGVAGIIAGRDNGDFTVGVAPGAPVTGVKVFSCEGLTFPSYIIQGVDWVTANAQKPAVVNMSLGSLIPLTALNTAVKNSALTGLFYAVAAGNGNPYTGQAVNACYSSPAGAGYDPPNTLNGIVTVAATDMADAEAGFSNYGVCVNIWAPGVAVTAPWLMSAGGTITASGTSFSSPYVAGAAALLLSRVPTLTPPLVEYVLRVTADTTGTLSKDGALVRRLNTSYW